MTKNLSPSNVVPARGIVAPSDAPPSNSGGGSMAGGHRKNIPAPTRADLAVDATAPGKRRASAGLVSVRPAARAAPPAPTDRVIMNEAQRRLVDARVTLGQLATACGVSRQAVSKWLAGFTKPSPPQRKIIARKFGPAEALWEQDPDLPEEPEREVEEEPADDDESPDDAKGKALLHLRRIERLRAIAERSRRSADLHRLLELERRAILDLAKFSGELTATEESRLTETPRWLAIRKAFAEAVSSCGGCSKRVTDALQRLEA